MSDEKLEMKAVFFYINFEYLQEKDKKLKILLKIV